MPKSNIEIEIVILVKQQRLIKKKSQGDIAEILKVSRGFVGQIEMPQSKSMYSYDQLNTLAKEFKCSLKDFMPEQAV